MDRWALAMVSAVAYSRAGLGEADEGDGGSMGGDGGSGAEGGVSITGAALGRDAPFAAGAALDA